jgi:hypothetical protein
MRSVMIETGGDRIDADPAIGVVQRAALGGPDHSVCGRDGCAEPLPTSKANG